MGYKHDPGMDNRKPRRTLSDYGPTCSGHSVKGEQKTDRWPKCLPHDCLYTDARNALIPRAERLADKATSAFYSTQDPDSRPINPRDTFRWSREFHEAMKVLAVEDGLMHPSNLTLGKSVN